MAAAMIATLTKELRFEASHQLHNHDGKCARPHGHSYRVLVEVDGPIKPADGAPDEGMVIDFSHISAIVKPLDHQDLNVVLAGIVTTAENIAAYILQRLLSDRPGLSASVTVYETATSSATVRA